MAVLTRKVFSEGSGISGGKLINDLSTRNFLPCCVKKLKTLIVRKHLEANSSAFWAILTCASTKFFGRFAPSKRFDPKCVLWVK